MSSLLITGVKGFIGSELARTLSRRGYKVLGTTREQPNFPENESIDIVIHCASQQPRKDLPYQAYFDGNFGSLGWTLDEMKKNKIRRIITFSTVAVYGDSISEVVNEETPPNPGSDYARSKWMADQLLQQRSEEDHLTGICLRLPSVFGPGQEGGLVDTYYEYARNQKDREVYSGGSLLRNLLYLDEVIQACEQALLRINEMEGYSLLLIGSSNSLTMGEIATYLCRKIGSRSQIRLVKTEAPVPSNWVLNLEKAQRVLGFVPRSIEDGIDRYCS